MSGIVTDVERSARTSTPSSVWGVPLFRRASGPVLAIFAACACTLLPTAHPAGADQLSSLRAQATQIEQQVQTTGMKISALGQQYDAAETKIAGLQQQIATTQAKIAVTQKHVSSDRSTLRVAAVNAFVNDGEAASQNPLFASNQKTLGAQQEFNHVAEGDVGAAVATLHNAQARLSAQESSLQSTKQAASAAAATAQAAQQQAQQEQSQQNAALSQAKGQIATLVAQQQAAAAAAAAAQARAKIEAAAQQQAQQQAAQAQQQAASQQAAASAAKAGTSGNSNTQATPSAPLPTATVTPATQATTPATSPAPTTPSTPTTQPSTPVYTAPPSSSGGGAAVEAAESQLGVPYVWGGTSPRGSPGDPSGGFDCSGLTQWSWEQAGVDMAHYSGAQMAATTPVPVNDLQPGDLLFYGPGGSEHVAMYVGGGTMIEAPYTGAVVWLTSVRLGDGFVGAGRP